MKPRYTLTRFIIAQLTIGALLIAAIVPTALFIHRTLHLEGPGSLLLACGIACALVTLFCRSRKRVGRRSSRA